MRDGEFSYLVGREKVFQAREEVGEIAIRRFALAIGEFNPLYHDEWKAKESRWGRIIAPTTLIFELGYDLGDNINHESGLQQGLLELLDNPKDINRVANEYEIFQTVRQDDVIAAKRQIKQVTEKETHRGKLVFITSEVSFSNQKGELLGINIETLACRY